MFSFFSHYKILSITLGGVFLTVSLIPLPVSALSVVVHIPEKYISVAAEERVYFEISIKYPENPQRKDLQLFYEITKDGDLITEQKTLKAIETQASFIDFIVLPETSQKGLHGINVKVLDYESLNEEVSDDFVVRQGQMAILQTQFFILLGTTLIMSGIIIFLLIPRKKKSVVWNIQDGLGKRTS